MRRPRSRGSGWRGRLPGQAVLRPRARRPRAGRALALAAPPEQEARAAAEEANRFKDEFLATVSHELRTPLCSIAGWASILSRTPPREATLARGLAIIARNAEAQRTIIEDILDMSRIITGRLHIEPEPVDFDAVVADAVDVVRPAALAKGIHVHHRREERSCRLVGDPVRLSQIVWNLLCNAIKFTPPGGHVEVALRRAGAAVELWIADSGEGISPALLPYIFDRFRQADGSATRRHGGLGLGLAIVRQLAELHGGDVRAESPGPGQGSTFTLRLPLPPALDVACARPEARAHEAGGA